MKDFGGLAKTTPFIGVSFILAALASLGLPGFSNFAGELLVFLGSWPKFSFAVGFAVFGVLISSIYLLRAVQSVCYGAPNPRGNPVLQDAKTFQEKIPFILLLGSLLIFGLWPQGLLRLIEPAVGAILP